MSTTLQLEALKMKHYKHNTISIGIGYEAPRTQHISTSVEDEAPQAQHYKEKQKQRKNI
jgi:hypothetical protein